MSKIKKFIWQGVDPLGFKVNGESAGYSVQEVELKLAQKKITPLLIRKSFEWSLFGNKNSVKEADITELSREFSVLVSASIPLVTALNIMVNSARKPAMKHLIQEIKIQIEDGHTLSDAIRLHEPYFGNFFRHLVSAGEHSGMLDLMLSYLAIYREKMLALKKKVKKALFYPCIVLVVALGVTGAMLVFVLPQFASLFQGVNAELPPLTKMVMGCSNFIREKGGFLLVGFFMVFVLLKAGIQRWKSWRDFLERFWLRCPVVGDLMQKTIFARCFRTLATTLQAGLPLLEALQLTANVAGNDRYIQAFSSICHQVKNGKKLSLSFQNTQLFSERSIQMMNVGEESGRLDEMLKKLAEYFEEQVDHKVQNLSQLLEPALMVILSLIIGTLVVAMYLPIFRLGTVF